MKSHQGHSASLNLSLCCNAVLAWRRQRETRTHSSSPLSPPTPTHDHAWLRRMEWTPYFPAAPACTKRESWSWWSWWGWPGRGAGMWGRRWEGRSNSTVLGRAGEVVGRQACSAHFVLSNCFSWREQRERQWRCQLCRWEKHGRDGMVCCYGDNCQVAWNQKKNLKREIMQKICSRLRDSRTPFAATGSLQEDALLLQPGEIRFKIQKRL